MSAGASRNDPFSEEALYAHVLAYDALGEHRSGSPGDLATADWNAAWLESLGFAVERQSFEVAGFRPGEAHVGLPDGTRIAAHPQWPVTPTKGIAAGSALYRAGDRTDGLAGKIAVVDFPFMRPSALLHPDHIGPIRDALGAGAAAIVGIPRNPSGDVVLLNAPLDLPAFPAPVALVAPRDAAPLVEAARAGSEVSLVLDGEHLRPAAASNVLGRLDRGGKYVCISTPQSGWFHCAGERGPGIAIWRALAILAARRWTRCSFFFAANSGHEFDFHGSHLLLEERAPKPAEVRLWVHLGAGLAARDWHEIWARPAPLLMPLPSADPQRYLMATPDILPVVKTCFDGVPGLEETYPATPATAQGELKEYAQAGYAPLFGGFGSHRFHHAPSDRADKTSGAILRPAALAFRDAIERLVG